MKRIYVITCIILISVTAFGQWHQIDTVNRQYNGISFANDTEGFLGGYGYYKKTTDGGLSWTFDTFPGPAYGSTTQFNFFDNGLILAGGIYASYRSTDDGNSWNDGGTTYPCCFLPNSIEGFSAAFMPFGDSAPTFKTYDAGNNWAMQGWTHPDPNGGFTGATAIAFADNMHGCIVTGEAGIYISNNGGIKWVRQVPYNNTIAFTSVYMKDSTTIFIVGNDVSLVGGADVIMRTTNGGLSWTTVFSNGFQLGKIGFANNFSGFVSGSFLVETTDGGNTWTVDTLLQGAVDFTFPAPDRGYLLTWDNIYSRGSVNQLRIYTGLPEVNAPVAFTLYPNPATDQLFIKTENIQPQSITVYDADGRLINTMPFKTEIDINQLRTGVYFVEVKSTEGVARKRFVKM